MILLFFASCQTLVENFKISDDTSGIHYKYNTLFNNGRLCVYYQYNKQHLKTQEKYLDCKTNKTLKWTILNYPCDQYSNESYKSIKKKCEYFRNYNQPVSVQEFIYGNLSTNRKERRIHMFHHTSYDMYGNAIKNVEVDGITEIAEYFKVSNVSINFFFQICL